MRRPISRTQEDIRQMIHHHGVPMEAQGRSGGRKVLLPELLQAQDQPSIRKAFAGGRFFECTMTVTLPLCYT